MKITEDNKKEFKKELEILKESKPNKPKVIIYGLITILGFLSIMIIPFILSFYILLVTGFPLYSLIIPLPMFSNITHIICKKNRIYISLINFFFNGIGLKKDFFKKLKGGII